MPDASPDDHVPEEIGFAHELLHSLAAIVLNLQHAKWILNEQALEQAPMAREDLSDLVDSALHEAKCQQHDALNLVSQKWPVLIGELGRADVQRISPLDLLNEMLPAYETKAAARKIGIRFSADHTGHMPPIEIEVNAMRRAFHNILSNALKYSYGGGQGRNRFVSIWCKLVDPDARRWSISFQNYGVGIERTELASVFRVGYRGLQARRERTYGCGFGLAEAKKCIEGHGGTVRIQSEPITEPESTSTTVYLTTIRVILPEHTAIRRRLRDGAQGDLD